MKIATMEVEIHQSFTTFVNEKDNYIRIFTKTQLKQCKYSLTYMSNDRVSRLQYKENLKIKHR